MIGNTTRTNVYRHVLLAASLAASLSVTSPGLAAATSASDATPHSDGIAAAISDTAITAAVKAKFLGDDRLKGSDISVKTTNGIVTLTGSTASSKSSSVASGVARSVDGVKSVDVELTTPVVRGSVSDKTQKVAAVTKKVVSDSWITTKVKAEILADSASKGFAVGVTTKNGVVMLDGKLATRDAITHVKDIAAKVEGVKSVNTAGLEVN
jgi:hyperosmotically inducible periplasmic protein